LGKSGTLIEGWCSKHGWVKRVAEWEQALDAARRKAEFAEVAKMQARHIQIAMNAQGLAITELQKAIKAAQDSKKSTISTADLLKLLDQGVKLERLNRGEPETTMELTGRMTFADLIRKAKAG